jgi:hypothetical protein
MRNWSAILVLSCVLVARASAQITFEDVTAKSGINFSGRSMGLAWGDYNGDGWPDLYTSNHAALSSLYANNHDGTFSNIFPSKWTNPSTPDKHGAAWADFDNDGDQDLLQLSGAGSGHGSSPNVFLVSNGDTLTNEALERGLQDPFGRGRTPLWLDWNNDGLLDVFMSNLARPDGQSPSRLFLQSGGQFLAQSLAALVPKVNSWFAQSSDLLGNGRLLIVHSPDGYPGPIVAFGSNPAVDLRAQLRIPTTRNVDDVAIADFNNDLRPDLFLVSINNKASDSVIVDSHTLNSSFNVNRTERGVTFRCECDLTFALGPPWEVSPSNVFIGAAGVHPKSGTFTISEEDAAVRGVAVHTPGVSFGVYIGFDAPTATWTLLVSKPGLGVINIVTTSSAEDVISALQRINFDPSELLMADRLLLNTSAGFVDASNQPALTVKRACQSVVAGDFDNDMYVDLYMVCRGQASNLPNVLLHNDGTGHFTEVPLAGGAEGSTVGRGEAVAMADFDNDGFLDLAVTNGEGEVPFANGPYQVFRNLGNSNHWLELQLRGVKSNRDGVGAKVILTAGGVQQLREQNGGVHRVAQNFQRVHFGLAGNTVARTVTVYWPSGVVQTLANVPADQILQVTEDVSASFTLAPGTLSFGNQVHNTRSAPQTVTLTNTGADALTALAITVAGANPGQFAKTTTCAATVAVGTSCTISVTFRPTTVGKKTAVLTVRAGGGAAVHTVALSGNGT